MTEDHDALVRLVKSVEDHVKNFDKHCEDNDQHFQRLYTSTGELKKIVYMMIGGLTILEVGLKFLSK